MTPPPAVQDDPFDRRAAAAQLASVYVDSCATTTTREGVNHIVVKFVSDGSVESAVVDSGPLLYDPITTEVACVTAMFKLLRVPAFSGAPVRVGKQFSIHRR